MKAKVKFQGVYTPEYIKEIEFEVKDVRNIHKEAREELKKEDHEWFKWEVKNIEFVK